MTELEAERQVLARELLSETEPDELEFFEEYVKAVDHTGQGRRLGPEWGIPELASVGPTAVAVGLYLFELFKSWIADVPKKTIEGFLVDGGKQRLKGWLGAPKKEEMGSMVTAKGKAEIMSILGRLVAEAKLSPHDAERLTRKVARHLFGDAA